jgi:peptidoglycan/LPS O-acetylase OafA/YrhL
VEEVFDLFVEPRRHAPRRLGRRPALDGLRAVAVMLVIGVHVGLLVAGYIGVDLFLALSGFLITALLYEQWERTGEISLGRFYERRARRLLPALVLLLAGFAVVTLVLHPFQVLWPLTRLIATTLLCANNWVSTLNPQHGSVLGALSPTWTLAQEVQFYLLWPPVLWGLLRLRVRPRQMLALLAVAIVALLVAGGLARHAYAAYNAYTSPFNRGAELLLGSAAAIVWRERLVPSPLRWPLIGWALVGVLVYVVAAGKPSDPVWYMSGAVIGALMIINLLSAPEGRGHVLERVLGSRPLAYTGKVSYGIYLFHVPIYYMVWTYARVGSVYLYWPIVFALSLATAAASWELIESPVLRGTWRRRGAPLAYVRRLASALAR